MFFDVKPVVVKAYGGRCFTPAKWLVLKRYQETRGRFYLFLTCRSRPGGCAGDSIMAKRLDRLVCSCSRFDIGIPHNKSGWCSIKILPIHENYIRRGTSCEHST